VSEERFWAKVQKTNGCWLWTGGKAGLRRQYGTFSVAGVMKRAHRVAWEFVNGAIPSGMVVCHRCDNPSCVRPDHLFVGTQAENVRDMHSKGRAAVRRGEESTAAKLSESQVFEVLRLCRSGMTQAEVSRATGVNASAVSRISRGESWAHLFNHEAAFASQTQVHGTALELR
jgi:hypothetical protein